MRIVWPVLLLPLAMVAATIAAMILGSFVSTARGRIGFDALSDLLVFAFFGGLIGLVTGIYGVMYWDLPRVRRATLIAGVVFVSEVVVLIVLNITGVF